MRRAFTLMELMVSIVLIVLITLFLYNAIATMKISNKTLAQHDIQENNRSKIFELFYRDFIEAVSLKPLKTKDKHYNTIELQTNNSLHQIVMPYVTYFVSRDKDALIRLEAAKEIELPVKYEDKYSIFVDKLIENVSDFNVYEKKEQPKQKTDKTKADDINNTISKSILLYLKTKNFKEPLLLELSI